MNKRFWFFVAGFLVFVFLLEWNAPSKFVWELPLIITISNHLVVRCSTHLWRSLFLQDMRCKEDNSTVGT